jgi:hypothetical protein
MKKILVLVALIAISAVAVNAQKRAIGARFGYGADFSYQHNMGEKNMLELEVGLPGLGIGGIWGLEVAGTYDWIFPISGWEEAGNWNWYAGVGAGAGLYDKYFFAGVAGRIGVEYNFDFPLNVSLDWRPIIGPTFGADHPFHNEGLFAGAIAWGIRYRF